MSLFNCVQLISENVAHVNGFLVDCSENNLTASDILDSKRFLTRGYNSRQKMTYGLVTKGLAIRSILVSYVRQDFIRKKISLFAIKSNAWLSHERANYGAWYHGFYENHEKSIFRYHVIIFQSFCNDDFCSSEPHKHFVYVQNWIGEPFFFDKIHLSRILATLVTDWHWTFTFEKIKFTKKTDTALN